MDLRLHSLRSQPIRVLLAFTAFKDSITADRLCDLVSTRLVVHNPHLSITQFPISDGGDGFLSTVERVVRRGGAEWERREMTVKGPLGETVTGKYGVMRKQGEDRVGVIEIAQISGLELVPRHLRNVYKTTNHGVGEVLTQLKCEGIRRLVFGLGGTSTIDCGMSILYALPCFHFSFDDHRHRPFLTGLDLDHITKVEPTAEYPQWADLELTAACDVKNTLLGPNGAVYMFGAQKGLNECDFQRYESTMDRIAGIAGEIRGVRGLRTSPHTGAAGGVLVGLKGGFGGTKEVGGLEMVSQLGGLREAVQTADVVFTGEGKYDAQTHLGKAVHHIRNLRPDAIIICGQNATMESEGVLDLTSRFGLEAALHSTEQCVSQLIDDLMCAPTRL